MKTPESLSNLPGAMNEVECAAYRGKLSDMARWQLLDEVIGLIHVEYVQNERIRANESYLKREETYKDRGGWPSGERKNLLSKNVKREETNDRLL